MTTTTQGAHAARETGMQTQTKVEWVEAKSASARQQHEVTELHGVRLATIRTHADDGSMTYFWCATARAAGTNIDVTDCGHGASLDEVRRAAVERASWMAWALARILETRPCARCDEATSVADLTTDDLCERCVAACTCATCGADVEPDGDDEPLCGDCADEQAAEDDGHCSTCHGTGIGQHGDPDSSFCHACDGGVRRPETDPYEAFDRWRDEQREL